MSDASAFLRKKKDKARVASRSFGQPAASSSNRSIPGSSAPSPKLLPQKSNPSTLLEDTKPILHDGSNIVEIKLISAPPDSAFGVDFVKNGSSSKSNDESSRYRYNLMKLNYPKEFDPTSIPSPLLLNRKQPNSSKVNQRFAYDNDGNIVGVYVYDEKGKPVLDDNGGHKIEIKDQKDLSLIGGADSGAGSSKTLARGNRKKGVKDVYSQDLEVMRLRREEATPWILESGNKSRLGEGGIDIDMNGNTTKMPEHWVGRYQEPTSLPTVLFINDGNGQNEFTVYPLGRTYKFEPERPFKVLNPDESNTLYEAQSGRGRMVHDLWTQRAGTTGPVYPADHQQSNGQPKIKQEFANQMNQAHRARRMEETIRQRNGQGRQAKVKVERFDDDDRKEGRGMVRGVEGGVDEELDFDEAEDFQDDDDVNTFYHNAEEEEDAKMQEDQLKKEYRLANANVGDRPQIEDNMEDEQDLFGNKNLTSDGRKLRKMMKKRRGEDADLFDSSDEDSDDDSEDEARKKKEEEKKEARRKEEEAKRLTSAERLSRPPSRGPGVGPGRNDRGATSPGLRQNSPTPTKGKSSTAPPGTGASLVAQRAAGSRGGSPMRNSRNASPRAASPDSLPNQQQSRSGSPALTGRGQSPPGRAQSPPNTASGRETSPALSTSGTSLKIKIKPTSSSNPNASGSAQSSKSASPSPLPSPNLNSSTASNPSSSNTINAKRKGPSPSPVPNDQQSQQPRKKKKSSNTPTPGPEDEKPFPNQITRDEVINWFRTQKSDRVPMGDVINAFKKRLQVDTPPEFKDRQQHLFSRIVGTIATKIGGGVFQFKSEYKK